MIIGDYFEKTASEDSHDGMITFWAKENSPLVQGFKHRAQILQDKNLRNEALKTVGIAAATAGALYAGSKLRASAFNTFTPAEQEEVAAAIAELPVTKVKNLVDSGMNLGAAIDSVGAKTLLKSYVPSPNMALGTAGMLTAGYAGWHASDEDKTKRNVAGAVTLPIVGARIASIGSSSATPYLAGSHMALAGAAYGLGDSTRRAHNVIRESRRRALLAKLEADPTNADIIAELNALKEGHDPMLSATLEEAGVSKEKQDRLAALKEKLNRFRR